MLTSQMIKEYALECGVDAVGISPMERFEGAPPELDPKLLLLILQMLKKLP